ncbi:Hypothetical_protein [Hexamita inflata]|uniref:Hypothetical_protein n=1 Tax=Hexamita inflata TaxID=28002 RepID=A0AA86UNW1_9EUKA|nr:Hypothetical protein HINF_LOCUS46547 [Hexamita inflata]
MGYEYCYYTENYCHSNCTKKYCKYNLTNALYCCSNSSTDWMYWVFGAIGVVALIVLVIIIWGLCEKRKLKYQKLAVDETDKLLKQQQTAEPQVQYSVPVFNETISVINPPQDVI